MHPVSFAQYNFQNNLLTLLLDAINDAEHVLLWYVLAVSREGQHKVTVPNLRQGAAFRFLCVFSFLCMFVVCSCLLLEGDGVELLNALSVDDGVPGLFLALVIFDGQFDVFTNESLQLFLQETLLVKQVLVCRTEVALHMSYACNGRLIKHVFVQVPVTDLLVKLVDLVANLLHVLQRHL